MVCGVVDTFVLVESEYLADCGICIPSNDVERWLTNSLQKGTRMLVGRKFGKRDDVGYHYAFLML